MYCLSLWQPWASLVISGKKKIETRSWKTSYRGTVIIHAAVKWDGELEELCEKEPFRSALLEMGILVPRLLPRGVILGTVVILDVLPAEKLKASLEATYTRRELAFGDYSAGRYGWTLDRAAALPTPIPYRGGRKLFDVDESILTGDSK